jgi:glycosyltransferase involved in cell wall biosynthesis
MCLDLAGPAMQVTQETGVKIAANTPGQAVTDMADALLSLARDRDRLSGLGKAARQRVAEQFMWEAKGNYMRTIYEELV